MQEGFFKSKEQSAISQLLFNHPIVKFIFLALIYSFLNALIQIVGNNYGLRILLITVTIIIAIYFILVIIYFIIRFINHLIKPKNLFALIGAYALFIFGIILILSTVLNIIDLSGQGYIKFGECTGPFNSNMIHSDNLRSDNFFYFSAITFFTVGYGDICPMGLAREFSVIAAFIGHLVSVLLVALIINNYLSTRRSNEN